MDTKPYSSHEHASNPSITASMSSGFCGSNNVVLHRLPSKSVSKLGWDILSSVVRPGKLDDEKETKTRKTWDALLEGFRGNSQSIIISRTTLVALLSVTNARCIWSFSGAAGYRANFPSYCGQWYIEWPIGRKAVVRLEAHDSHTIARDVYPPSFESKVDKCMQMTAGVVIGSRNSTFKVAFPGRKPLGQWILELREKGFSGAHGSRHLYNMNGGKVFEVDLLVMRELKAGEKVPEGSVNLQVPSLEEGVRNTLIVPKREQLILEEALDLLPWTSLSWSIHRGLRDVLMAYSKNTMDEHRKVLAQQLRQSVAIHGKESESRGWEPVFVSEYMAEMAATSVMSGGGNSGDLVRVVTGIAELIWDGSKDGLDETLFWRKERKELADGNAVLSSQAVIALVKCFVLEWSNEFDYQMYHELPQELVFE